MRRITIVILIALSLFYFSCHNQKGVETSVTIQLDSIFINAYEKGEFRDVPYIFFYYTLRNTSESLKDIYVRRWNFEDTTEFKAYCVFKEDTLELFGGNLTPEKISLKPSESRQIDFNLDPIMVVSLFDRLHDKYKNHKDLMIDIAKSSRTYFILNDKVLNVRIGSNDVIYRSSKDSSIVEWK